MKITIPIILTGILLYGLSFNQPAAAVMASPAPPVIAGNNNPNCFNHEHPSYCP